MTRTKHNTDQLHIRLPSDLVNQARNQAKREQRPLSEIIRELLRMWLATTK